MNKINWNFYKFQDDKNQNDDDDDNDDNNMDNDFPKGKLLKFPNELISTPVGDIPASEGWNPLKDRNIYIANVNFVITELHVKLIAIVLGVEHIHVISPYSFSIIVGMMFNDEEVLDDIEQVIEVKSDRDIDTSEYIDDNSPLYDIVSPVLHRLVDKKYWIFYVFPNGKVFEKTYETEEDFNIAVSNFSSDSDNEDFIDYSEGLYFDSKKKLD